ncbi:MAG TPA: hypothetical protein VEU51_16490 [Candidatus Acidoferrales bacterium]|nr:hypothetical protein [Candidatus Acidoferrales bacterium]
MRQIDRVRTGLGLLFIFVLMAAVCSAPSRAWCAAASLWVADEGNNRVVEVIPKQLKHSGTPFLIFDNSASISTPGGVCFDAAKNLWVTGFNDAVLEFTPAQLNALPTTSNPVPVTTIISMHFSETVGCTFDSQGNLWVIDAGAKGVHEVSKAQLAAGTGTIVPAISVTATTALDFPNFATWDKGGNLWITSEDNSRIAEFSVSQLSSSGDKAPAVLLSDNGSGSLDEPGQPAFDGKGNLWVPNYTNSTVVMFQKSDLGVSGSPNPKVTLHSASGSLDGPWGLTFQGKGPLWVSNYSSGTVAKFLPSQIKKNGSPVPKVVLQSVQSNGYQIVFGPVF